MGLPTNMAKRSFIVRYAFFGVDIARGFAGKAGGVSGGVSGGFGAIFGGILGVAEGVDNAGEVDKVGGVGKAALGFFAW